MGKAKRKMRPQPPWWWTLDNDNCWFCKNRNNCGGCKLLKQQRSESREKQGESMNLSKKSEKAIDIAGRIMSAVLVTSAAELYRDITTPAKM